MSNQLNTGDVATDNFNKLLIYASLRQDTLHKPINLKMVGEAGKET